MHDAMTSNTAKPATNVSSLIIRLNDAVRGALIDLLRQQLPPYFDTLPSHLVTAASSLPDAEQRKMMDMLVEIRAGRARMEGSVTGLIDEQLRRFVTKAQAAGSAGGGLGLGEMSLVGTDEMDVTVALDTSGSRLATAMEPVIGDAYSRLQVLIPTLTDPGQMPFHPRTLLQVFLDVLAPLNLDSAQKIEFLRWFIQDFKVEGLAETVDQAMTQAGIPELSKTIRNADTGSARPEEKPDLVDVLKDIRDLNSKTAGGGGAGAGGGSTLGSGPSVDEKGVPILHTAPGGGMVIDPSVLIQQAERFAQISASVANVPLAPQNVSPLAVEQTVQTNALMEILTRLQDIQPRTHVDIDPTAPSVGEVRDSIRNQLKNDDDHVEMISKKDTDVINLVSMLFDFILDDQDLPTAMKALLGRLQIPMLKVAILDPTFFKTEDHPARLLLNSLAKAGVGWDENAKSSDQLYKKLEETVFTILNEFEGDLSLFDRLLEEFERFYADQQVKVTAMDQRTRESEESRARAEMARTIVQQGLNRRLNGRKLPFAVVRLLQEGWRHVLYLACLKEGTESESWKQAIKVVDALIWSMMPVEGDAQWIERLKSVAPKLINSLRKGLASVHFDTLQTETLLREITRVHQEIIEGYETAMVEIVDQETASTQSGFDGVSVDQALKATQPNMKAVVLPASEAQEYQGETLPQTDRNVVAVKNMVVGTWIEFIASERRDRHKLVAKIRSSEKMIFANRRGIKVAEMSQMQLAVELSQGRARIVEEQPQIIDRALQSVVGGLRQLSA